jgi:hypothetical protein
VERRVAADRDCFEGYEMMIQLIKHASEKSRYLIAASRTSVFILRDVCQVLLKFKRLTSFRRLSEFHMLIILYSASRIWVQKFLKEISGFRRDVNKICVLLGHYAAYSVNSLPMFRNNLTVPLSRVEKSNVRSNHLTV